MSTSTEINRDPQVNVTVRETAIRQLGELLKSIRLSTGMGQIELANYAGVSQNIIGNIERGLGANLNSLMSVMIALDVFDDIAKALEKAPKNKSRLKQQIARHRIVESMSDRKICQGVDKSVVEAENKTPVLLTSVIFADVALEMVRKYPDRYYRISRASYDRLTNESRSNIALTARTQLAYSLNDEERDVDENDLESIPSHLVAQPKLVDVFYITSAKNAIENSELAWFIEGMYRLPDMTIEIELDRNVVSLHSQTRKSLRRHFRDLNVFVDKVSSDDKTRIISVKNREQEVGARFYTHLNKWIEEVVEAEKS